MSTQDTSNKSGGDSSNDEPVSKEFFLSLTPELFEKLPPARRKAVVEWLTNHPHRLDGRPSTKKESK